MPLINCKVELRLNEPNTVFWLQLVLKMMMLILIVLFSLSKTQKIICPCSHFISKRNGKLLKLLSKGFKRSLHWNEYKAKSKMKHMTNKYRYFTNQTF